MRIVRTPWLAAAAMTPILFLTGLAKPQDLAASSRPPASPPAQEAPAAGVSASANGQDQIGEIIVTAQRRAENAQRAALSIEVLGGDLLRDAGISRPDDLTKLAPGFQIGGGTTTQIYVRGVGDFGVTATANPGVLTNLDGVVISRPQAISGNFFDLERVELLRGPQGTLYGRNATGGALNLLSVAPKLGELSGYVEGTVGNYDQYGLEGAVNVPASEKLAFRLSYQINRRHGYLTDGGDDDDHGSIRLQSLFVSDAFTARTEFDYTHLGGNGTGLVRIPAIPGQSPWTGTTSPVAGAAYIAAAAAQFQASGGQSVPPVLIANPADTKLFQDVQSYSALAQLDYDMDFATLTAIPAYRRTESRFAVAPQFTYNVGGIYDAAGDRSNGETADQYSIEVRLAKETERLKWVVGGYGFREVQSTDYVLNGGPILFTRPEVDLHTDAWAPFGQLTYSVTDRLRATVGVRGTQDKRTASNLKVYAISPSVTAPAASTGNLPVPCLPAVGFPPGTLCPLINTTPGFYDSSVTFRRVTWKGGLEFDLGPQSMLYADVSTGFKAGGFSLAVSLTDPNQLAPYQPEKITAYTLGIKNRFFNNTVQFNAETFYWKYRDLQLSTGAFDGTDTVVILTENAGEATIKGANFDLVVKPWRGATFHGLAEYDDTRYDSFVLHDSAVFYGPGRTTCPVSAPNAQGIVSVDCSGRPLIRAPKWSGDAGYDQEFGLGSNGDLTFGVDAGFASRRYIGIEFLPGQLARAYANVSSTLTYNSPQKRWYVGAFVRNLTNAAIYTGGGGAESAFVTGWTTSNISPPRTYGGRIGMRF